MILGIGSEAKPKGANENWWDQEDHRVSANHGEQAELFDATGRVISQPEASVGSVEAVVPASKAKPVVSAIPQTVVSVQSKSKTTARVVATTRVVTPVRAVAVSQAVPAVRGGMGRQLVRSQSISSGREESRWFSVPQRVLLPRYQLFEGGDAVTEDERGLRIGSPSMRTQSGRVWFV